MQYGTSTAFVDVQLGHVLGLEAADLGAVFYGAMLKDVGCGVSGVVLARSSLARAGPLRLDNGREGQMAARRARRTGVSGGVRGVGGVIAVEVTNPKADGRRP